MHPTFGRYELLKRLAGGGMGEVFLARQRGIDGFQKLLVLKTLLPHLCEDEEFITMFKDEARVTAQLIHPNICQVFEFEQVNGVYYMAMEYLRGEDLRRLWKACEQRGTPLRVPLLCRIVADAAAGLDFAHALRDGKGEPYRIVHRDISPQNILVTFEGGVKVIDFGVAKAAGRAQHTRTGALKGKYSYMSPEQVAGAEVDGRSDIFALGIVLHELLTGRRLFKADSDVQTLARVRECKVPLPSELNPQLPPGIDPVVLKALAKDPAHRFATAQEFRLALEDWLIQGRMSASSAHLAEFLKTIYADRLDRENRLGPLLGDPGFSGPAPGGTPAVSAAAGKPSQPSAERRGDASPLAQRGSTEPTVNQKLRGPLLPPDSSTARTWSDAAPFRSDNRFRASVGLGALAIVVSAAVVLSSGRKQPPAAPGPAAQALSLAAPPDPAAPQQTAVPQRAASRKHIVTITTRPPGVEIYEGTRRIGTSPQVWTDAAEGTHELTLRHEGYREQKGTVQVKSDGQEFPFKLTRSDAPKKIGTPGLDIKAER